MKAFFFGFKGICININEPEHKQHPVRFSTWNYQALRMAPYKKTPKQSEKSANTGHPQPHRHPVFLFQAQRRAQLICTSFSISGAPCISVRECFEDPCFYYLPSLMDIHYYPREKQPDSSPSAGVRAAGRSRLTVMGDTEVSWKHLKSYKTCKKHRNFVSVVCFRFAPNLWSRE